MQDAPAVARSFGRALRRAGCEVLLAHGVCDALAVLARAERPDVMLLDLHLGDGSGEDVLDALAQGPGFGPPRESA